MSFARRKTAFAMECSVMELCRQSTSPPVLVTLTFAETLTDYQEARRRFRCLRERMRRKYPGLELCGAWELQKRGVWHPHFVANQFIDVKWLRLNAIQCGFGRIMRLDYIAGSRNRKADSVRRAARYICKYVTKEIGTNVTGKGNRVVFFHGGARRATVRFSWSGGLNKLWRLGRSHYYELFGVQPKHHNWQCVVRIGWELLTGYEKSKLLERCPKVANWWFQGRLPASLVDQRECPF